MSRTDGVAATLDAAAHVLGAALGDGGHAIAAGFARGGSPDPIVEDVAVLLRGARARAGV